MHLGDRGKRLRRRGGGTSRGVHCSRDYRSVVAPSSEPAPSKPIILLTKPPDEKRKPEEQLESRPSSSAGLVSLPEKSVIITKSTEDQRRRTLPFDRMQKAAYMPPQVGYSPKLITESMEFSDTIHKFLSDRINFRVIGCLGYHATGKSRLMCYLAEYGDAFGVSGLESDQRIMHMTQGVDIYITQDRTIVLDCQPILSSSVFNDLFDNEKRDIPGYQATDILPSESSLIVSSLQLASFLFAVCHTVIFVDDCTLDYDTISFLRAAEMLKPATPLASEQMFGRKDTEYYPHLVFVHNRCSNAQMTSYSQNTIRELYSYLLSDSRLKYRDNVCNDHSESDVNAYFLPMFDESHHLIDFDARWVIQVRELVGKIHLIDNECILPVPLTEKQWLLYAQRIWESVRKSSLCIDYERLMRQEKSVE